MTVADSLLFLVDTPMESAIEEFLDASAELARIQGDGHPKCPNTNDKPAPCSYCLKHFGDKYKVWKLLMVTNAPAL